MQERGSRCAHPQMMRETDRQRERGGGFVLSICSYINREKIKFYISCEADHPL